MPVPILAAGRAPNIEGSAAPGAIAAPIPFWSAVGDAFKSETQLHTLGSREGMLSQAFQSRNEALRRSLGQNPVLNINGAALPLDNPAVADILTAGGPAAAALQAQIDPLIGQNNSTISTTDQVRSQVAARLSQVGQAADQAAAQHPVGSFVGGAVGSMTDPVNVGVSAIPGVGEAQLGAKLLWGTADAAGRWGLAAAAQAPLKQAEAQQVGGPAYGDKEALADVEGGVVSGGVLHAGATLLEPLVSAAGARLMGQLGPGESAASGAPGAAPGPDANSGPAPPPGSEPPPSSGPSGAEAQPPPPSSSSPAPLDTSGRFPVDASNQVVSDAGGPIQFDSPTDAARWILRDGHRQSIDQRFEPANHPQGGYTAREFVRATGDAAADEVEPDAVPAAAAAVETGALDAAATGPARAGGDYDAGLASLQKGEPAPDIEQTQDPSTLLTDADPAAGPVQASPATPPTQPGVTIGSATTYRGRSIYAASFDPRTLSTAPELFQYKAGGDSAGVTDRLQGVQTWDPTSAGRIMAWEAPDGSHLVADGHQRLGLANRLTSSDAFTTAKGSSYVVHEDGTTTRDKASRPEHPGEQGIQPRSQDTFYVDGNGLDQLSTFQTQGQGKLTLVRRGGRAAVRFDEGQFAGKFDQHSLANVQQQPDVGLYPVETWNNGSRVHFGNAITAVRKGQSPTLDGVLFRSSDGWSAQDVRTIAALKNIREGSGTPLDAAKVFRDHPTALNDDSLPVTGSLAEQGRGLARLSPEAFGAAINEVIPARQAALIGNMAPDRPELHAGLIDLLHRGEPANGDEAQALIAEALHDDWLKTEGDTADLFGGAPDQSTVIARAKIRAAVLQAVRRNGRLFGTLVRQADAIEGGGNVLARTSNESQLANNRTALALITKLAERSGDVGDAMREAARAVMSGKSVAAAAKDVLARVTNEIGAADQAEAERKLLLEPAPPSADALSRADLFDDVGGAGQAAQMRAKSEEAADETAHLAEVLGHDPSSEEPLTNMGNAARLLKSCTPE